MTEDVIPRERQIAFSTTHSGRKCGRDEKNPMADNAHTGIHLDKNKTST